MNDIQIFKNKEFGEIRTVEINNEPWFVGKDIAGVLGYSNHRKALIDHVDDEDKTDGVTIRDSMGREQNPILINESGLYSLILSSKLPNAKRFKKWVTSEVLPTIRKHGAYMTDETLKNAILDPDFLIQLATRLKDEQDKNLRLQATNSRLEVENEIMTPKAEYFDELVSRNLLTNFRDTAKLLKIKERKFINYLLDKGYLYRDKKGTLMPKASRNTGLFEVKEYANLKSKWTGTQTLVTPLGREHFRMLLVGV